MYLLEYSTVGCVQKLTFIYAPKALPALYYNYEAKGIVFSTQCRSTLYWFSDGIAKWENCINVLLNDSSRMCEPK
jgi:hypothetical protein